jgi:hypothetical protein
VLTVRGAKFGKSRQLPLHPTTTAKLGDYLDLRDQLLPRLPTHLGHTDPKHTCWYLSATPELIAFAADRPHSHQIAHQPGRLGDLRWPRWLPPCRRSSPSG